MSQNIKTRLLARINSGPSILLGYDLLTPALVEIERLEKEVSELKKSRDLYMRSAEALSHGADKARLKLEALEKRAADFEILANQAMTIGLAECQKAREWAQHCDKLVGDYWSMRCSEEWRADEAEELLERTLSVGLNECEKLRYKLDKVSTEWGKFRGLAERAVGVAEYTLRLLSENNLAARIALRAIQPVALTFNPNLANEIFSIERLVQESNQVTTGMVEHFYGKSQHWAMHHIANSLAESLLAAPNYITATIEIPFERYNGLETFTVTVHKTPGGKDPHSLRLEAESLVEQAMGAGLEECKRLRAKLEKAEGFDVAYEKIQAMLEKLLVNEKELNALKQKYGLDK